MSVWTVHPTFDDTHTHTHTHAHTHTLWGGEKIAPRHLARQDINGCSSKKNTKL